MDTTNVGKMSQTELMDKYDVFLGDSRVNIYPVEAKGTKALEGVWEGDKDIGQVSEGQFSGNTPASEFFKRMR